MEKQNRPRKILVSGSQTAVGTALKNALTRMHYMVVDAENGKQVVNILEKDPKFDLILADLEIEELGGLELVKWVKDKGIIAPVIVLTDVSDMEKAVLAMKAGAFDYLGKPVNDIDLKLTIDKAIEYKEIKEKYLEGEKEKRRYKAELEKKAKEQTDDTWSMMGSLPYKLEQAPPKQILKYSPGQLILKEGDFGTSLYRIRKGNVKVLKEIKQKNILLTELGKGDIFGEMVFIDGGLSPRTASVEAKGEVELESLHHLAIRHEYQSASEMIRHMAANMVKKLTRISAIHDRLRIERKTKDEPKTALRLAGSKKMWDGKVTYRPVSSRTGQMLNGNAMDIDIEGLRLQVTDLTFKKEEHVPGVKIDMFLHLPGREPLQVSGEITNSSRGDMSGYTAFRVKYCKLESIAKKKLETFLRD